MSLADQRRRRAVVQRERQQLRTEREAQELQKEADANRILADYFRDLAALQRRKVHA